MRKTSKRTDVCRRIRVTLYGPMGRKTGRVLGDMQITGFLKQAHPGSSCPVHTGAVVCYYSPRSVQVLAYLVRIDWVFMTEPSHNVASLPKLRRPDMLFRVG